MYSLWVARHVYGCVGERAGAALGSLVRWSPVTCQPQGSRDKYGRVVARCSVPRLLLGVGPPVDLSAAMVSAGHAIVYRCAAPSLQQQREHRRGPHPVPTHLARTRQTGHDVDNHRVSVRSRHSVL